MWKSFYYSILWNWYKIEILFSIKNNNIINVKIYNIWFNSFEIKINKYLKQVDNSQF